MIAVMMMKQKIILITKVKEKKENKK